MPIYEYQASDLTKCCNRCRDRFEQIQKMSDPPLERCPWCDNCVQKLISAHSVGGSGSGFDDRAKNAGFHKLKKLGKGEYEKQY